MAGQLEGKVALVSGAARGQGRSHAIALAREGADIIAFDVDQQIDAVNYPMASAEDLAETVAQVEALDRRIVSGSADVRDRTAVQAVVDEGVAQFGRVDIVVAHAGICVLDARPAGFWEISQDRWDAVLDTNLKGVWNTVSAAVPSMLAHGEGGAIVLTSSTAGIKGLSMIADYTASKHGVVGLMRAMANELAPHSIRVNSVHPTGVNTPMINNDAMTAYIEARPDVAEHMGNALPIPVVEPEDISAAVLFLVTDAGRYVTGVMLPVDAGATIK